MVSSDELNGRFAGTGYWAVVIGSTCLTASVDGGVVDAAAWDFDVP